MIPVFEAYQSLYGFDKSAQPAWQMVPLDGEKYVYLKNADSLTVQIKDSRIAQVSEAKDAVNLNIPNRRLLLIKGLSYGKTFLEVLQNNLVKTRLEIAVKNPRTTRLSFNFLASGKSATRKTPSMVPGWMDELNAIYTAQANVSFVLESIKSFHPSGDFGPELDETDAKLSRWEWESMVANRDAKADFNVFLVRKIIYFTDAKTWRFPKGTTSGSDCAIGDEIFISEELELIALAHEIGHFLGVPGDQHLYHPKNRNRFMMYYQSKFSGREIPKLHANLLNP